VQDDCREPRAHHAQPRHAPRHAALRNILGNAHQAGGSLNAPDRCASTFAFCARRWPKSCATSEQPVNDEIRLYKLPDRDNVTSLEGRPGSGSYDSSATKYPESKVRVVNMADPRRPAAFLSKELLRRDPSHRRRDIGVIKIVSDAISGRRVRRIRGCNRIGGPGTTTKSAPNTQPNRPRQTQRRRDDILATVEKLSETSKHLEKQLEAQKRKAPWANWLDLTSSSPASQRGQGPSSGGRSLSIAKGLANWSIHAPKAMLRR